MRRETHTEDRGRQRQIDTDTEADMYMRTQALTRNSTQMLYLPPPSPVLLPAMQKRHTASPSQIALKLDLKGKSD